MIEVVTCRNAHLYSDALDEMFHLRHRIFVEKMGWEALRKPDRLERDQFDNEHAIYLLLTDDDGTVIGCHRMLPTVHPHLFSDVFPEMCAVKGVQRGQKILELTRTCVDEFALDRKETERARKRLMVGVFEFLLRGGFTHMTVMTPTDLLFRYLLIGFDVKPLGLPMDMDGTKQVASILTITQESVDAIRQAFAVPEPLVVYLGATEDDPLKLMPVEMPQVTAVAAE